MRLSVRKRAEMVMEAILQALGVPLCTCARQTNKTLIVMEPGTVPENSRASCKPSWTATGKRFHNLVQKATLILNFPRGLPKSNSQFGRWGRSPLNQCPLVMNHEHRLACPNLVLVVWRVEDDIRHANCHGENSPTVMVKIRQLSWYD